VPLRDSYLVQLLLPVRDNNGRVFSDATWESLKTKLVEKFGGVTAFQRTPAEGIWAPASERRAAEDVFMVEVMTQALDEAWWASLQAELEHALAQEHVVIRAIKFSDIGGR
jgi:hypothetical protein